MRAPRGCARPPGRRGPPPRRLYVIEYLGNNRARWECADGHTWIGPLLNLNKGQTRAAFRKTGVPESTAAFYVSWWSKAKNGCWGTCPIEKKAGQR